MPASSPAQTLTSYLQPLMPNYLEELGQLCAIESPSDHKSGVDEVGAWVQQWVAQHGWQVEVWSDETVGNSIVATVQGGGKLRVMLAAHMDTVYPPGTLSEHPLRTEGDKLIGPGTADNKGGLLSGLYAIDALQQSNLLDHFATVSMVCGGDEETDMRSSEALLRHLAPSYDLALILEPGRPNGAIVSARKGIANYVLEAHGKSAHAGVEPHRGANAVLSLAHQIVALQALNGTREGLTVNVGVVAGGTRPNVVADYARAEVDVRVVQAADMEVVSEQIADIAANSPIDGVTTTLSGGWHFGPMARTSQVADLVSLAQSCAEELGFSLQDVATGGGSYANTLSSVGLALLDGLGPIGGHLHSPDEYIAISSIVPRIALISLLMLRHAEQTA
ncbi:MAG: M20 family metallopeptidase [Abitibacteriaceae bacterium]|nr:M20 family metallopeptidase [Abditibacteriaceae bacterium]MBV9868440.1 M20 family metallopeptidase [Abditibacteriaceae bacterium]